MEINIQAIATQKWVYGGNGYREIPCLLGQKAIALECQNDCEKMFHVEIVWVEFSGSEQRRSAHQRNWHLIAIEMPPSLSVVSSNCTTSSDDSCSMATDSTFSGVPSCSI